MSHGKFIWNELMAYDTDAAKTFYSETLGWTWESMDMGEGMYHVASAGDTQVAGLMEMLPHLAEMKIPSHWMGYIGVDDMSVSFEKAKAAGAKIMREPFEVPGVGTMVIMEDAAGAVIALMQEAGQPG